MIVALLSLAAAVATPAEVPPLPIGLKGGAVVVSALFARTPMPPDHAKPTFPLPIAQGPGYWVGGLHVKGAMPLHRHKKRTEVVHVVAGKGTFRVGDQSLKLEPGQVIVIPQGEPHGFTLDGTGQVTVVAVGEYDPADMELLTDTPAAVPAKK
jgi:mannose-6-phosphate isomerase-like protein (cupin superfamily)